jgi:hypothetical protein
MWLYHFAQNNKLLTYSTYLIFMMLGMIAFSRTVRYWDSITQLYPILFSFGLIIGLFLLFINRQFAFISFLSISSVLLITTIYIEISSIEWVGNELVQVFLFLLAISSVISLFIFEGEDSIAKAIGLSILYSTILFIILIISRLFQPLSAPFLLVLLVGQVVSYSVSMLLLPFYSSRSSDSIPRKQKGAIKEYQERSSIINGVLSVLYFLVILSFIVYVVFILGFYKWIMIWFFSLFLVAGLFNSFRKALIIHILLLSVVLAPLASKLFLPTIEEWELVTGVIVFLGVGLYPLFTWFYTKYHNPSLYTLAFITFISAIFPMLLGRSLLPSYGVTIVVLAGYIIVSGVSILYYPIFERQLFLEKKRGQRPYLYEAVLSHSNEDKGTEEIEKFISGAQRERELVQQYKEWLRKREGKLAQSFSKKDD